MPQTGQLPTVEPVAMPQASPGEFASAGAGVAKLGQETANMAQANVAFEGHLAYAQRQLTYKQIEIDVSKLEEQAHNDLRTATTPEQAQQIKDDFTKRVSESLGPHMGDKALARELHLYSQQVDVEMQHNVNAKKADIITKNGRAADGILVSKAEQEAVNTRVAGGSTDGIMEATRQKLNASVSAGIWQPEDVEVMMRRLAKKVDIGEIKAKYNSKDPEVRKQIMEQLSDDTKFPSLDDADRAAYRVAAEKRNRELNNAGKQHSYNAAVTKMNDVTEGWPYENKAKVVTTDKWLKENGIVDEEGNPDHEMGDKLLAEVNRQEAADRKADDDKAVELTDKLMSKVDRGKLADNQIDKLVDEQGGSERASVKAKSSLKAASHQAIGQQMSGYRFGEFVKDAGHRAYVREYHKAHDNGEPISSDLMQRMTNGESIDMSRVWDTVAEGDMTKSQALQVQSHMEHLKNADYKYNSERISNASGFTDKEKVDMSMALLDAANHGKLQGNALYQLTDKLLEDHGKKVTSHYIEEFMGNLFKPPLSKGTTLSTSTKPKEGDTKKNSAGDDIRFTSGKWVIQ